MNQAFLGVLVATVALLFNGCKQTTSGTSEVEIINLGRVALTPGTPKEIKVKPGATCTLTPGARTSDNVEVRLTVVGTKDKASVATSLVPGQRGGVSVENLAILVTPEFRDQ